MLEMYYDVHFKLIGLTVLKMRDLFRLVQHLLYLPCHLGVGGKVGSVCACAGGWEVLHLPRVRTECY